MKTQVDWAPQKWFIKNASDSSFASYFDHDNLGYQVYRHKQYIKVLKRNINYTKIGCFLDIGCATGTLTNKIKNEIGCSEVYGIDFVEKLIENANNLYPDIKFLYSELPNIKVNSFNYDLIIASEVIYYLKYDSQLLLIENIYNCINDGGYFIIGSKIGDNYFNKKTLKNLLKGKFLIKDEIILNLKLYNKIYNYLILLNRFYYFIKNDKLPSSGNYNNVYSTLRLLFSNLIGINIIKLFCIFARPFLLSNNLPSLIQKIIPFEKPSNIILLCKKIAR